MEKSRYLKGKEKAQAEAIAWSNDFGEHDYTYSELTEYHNRFTKLGKRYGLLKEFKENGII